MRDVQCGKVVIRDGLALAPMAGVTDRSFRRVCRRFGAAYTVSEMVSAKALCLEQAIRNPDPSRIISGELASVMPDEMPMAVQLFGHEPDVMAEAASRLASGDFRGRAGHVIPAAVDINMGCPVRKIVGNGEGSALMRDPALAGRIVQAVVRAAEPLPVTVKLRAGFDESSLNAPELARVCEAAGAAMLCIHGRTRAQGYAPGVNRAVIRAVKQAVRIPVLANGDIYTPADALSMLAETGCDGIMVARGAMGRPWLFAEIRAALRGEDYTPPDPEQRFDIALEQVRAMIREKGDRVGLAEAKKHLAWYCTGLDGAAECRARIMRAGSLDEMQTAVRALAAAQDGRLRALPPRSSGAEDPEKTRGVLR